MLFGDWLGHAPVRLDGITILLGGQMGTNNKPPRLQFQRKKHGQQNRQILSLNHPKLLVLYKHFSYFKKNPEDLGSWAVV